MEEGLEAAERIGVGIGLAVYTQRLDRACRVVESASVRSVTVNAPVGSEGFGPAGPWYPGLGAYAEWRSVVLRPGRGWRRVSGHSSGGGPPPAPAGSAPAGPERPKT